MEKGKIMILWAVDLSTALDTVDNKILLQVLQNKYGVGGSVYRLCESYLSLRKFCVKISNHILTEL